MSIIVLPTIVESSDEILYRQLYDIGHFSRSRNNQAQEAVQVVNNPNMYDVKTFRISNVSELEQYSHVDTSKRWITAAVMAVSSSQFSVEVVTWESWRQTYDRGIFDSRVSSIGDNYYHCCVVYLSSLHTEPDWVPSYSGIYLNAGTYNTVLEGVVASGVNPIPISYPITYSFTNSTVSGPSEAAIGDTVIVSAIPDVGYGITDASTQILVTNNDIAVPYTWDATNNRITFTMPDPT